jgi:hypothetical protein
MMMTHHHHHHHHRHHHHHYRHHHHLVVVVAAAAAAAVVASLPSSSPADSRNLLRTPPQALMLEYRVKWPLSLVLSRRAVTKYQLLFRHLFLIKWVERGLHAAWADQQTTKVRQSAIGLIVCRTKSLVHISRLLLIKWVERGLHAAWADQQTTKVGALIWLVCMLHQVMERIISGYRPLWVNRVCMRHQAIWCASSAAIDDPTCILTADGDSRTAFVCSTKSLAPVDNTMRALKGAEGAAVAGPGL